MKCSNCQNVVISPRECNLCQEKFCSEECILSHNQLYHQSNLEESHIDNSINNNSFLNYAKEESNRSSPFLIKGIMNYDYIKYDPLYSPDNLTLVYSNGIPKTIGNGSFGQVFLAINNIDKKIYAIKHMEKEKLIKFLNCLDPIYAEIDIQSRVNHPNIIKLLYVRETDVTFDLVMDYAKDGTLFDFVVKNRGLPEKLAFKYFIQIVNAIKFLHDNDVIHRDIKPENILLFDNDVAKLCDFGWSIKCVDRLPGGSFTGTTEYMAPELINNMDYGKEIDMWMLGILLYELMHGFSPFRPKKQTFEDKEVVDNIQSHNINFYMPVSEDCKELIFSLLETDVKKRCTIDGIFNSKFVKSFEKEENDISSHFEKDENNENVERENRISNSIGNSNINAETQNESISMPISKSQLLNRYTENDDLNDSKKVISKNYQFFNTKRIESDNLSNSKLSHPENVALNNSKQNPVDISLNIDDPYEDEPNAPKNNKRNRNKNNQNNKNIKNSISKLKFNFNNENILSPVKKIDEENQENSFSNSPKNNNKNKKKNSQNDLNFDLNPNIIINNNLLTSRRFREKDKDKDNIEINEDRKIQKKKELMIDNNNNASQKPSKQKITNYIFNNNKEINPKSKIVGKKLALNTNNINKIDNNNNQILSLSLSPGTAEYASLLARSVSPDKPSIFPKDKKDFKRNSKYHLPVDVSDNWSNTSQNLREYPFDHFASNSSLDIRKPISNHNEINENDDDEREYVKEKEPNDNMRRKNKREEIPRDNTLKNNLNKNINPKDNNKKGRSLPNNINKNRYEVKTTNSALNEPIRLNSLNPFFKIEIKKSNDINNETSKATSIRNFSVSTTDDYRTRRQNSDDINKNSFIRNDNFMENKTKSKDINFSTSSKNDNNDIILSKNLKGILTPKIIKSNKINQKHMPLKKISNKNMSFISKTKNQILLKSTNNIKNKEKRLKIEDKKRNKKGGSVNRQNRTYLKFNNIKNDKKEIRQLKLYKNNNIENKEIKKNENIFQNNNININKQNIEIINKEDKNEENECKEKNENKINEVLENNQIEQNKGLLNNEDKQNTIIDKEKENEESKQKTELIKNKEIIEAKEKKNEEKIDEIKEDKKEKKTEENKEESKEEKKEQIINKKNEKIEEKKEEKTDEKKNEKVKDQKEEKSNEEKINENKNINKEEIKNDVEMNNNKIIYENKDEDKIESNKENVIEEAVIGKATYKRNTEAITINNSLKNKETIEAKEKEYLEKNKEKKEILNEDNSPLKISSNNVYKEIIDIKGNNKNKENILIKESKKIPQYLKNQKHLIVNNNKKNGIRNNKKSIPNNKIVKKIIQNEDKPIINTKIDMNIDNENKAAIMKTEIKESTDNKEIIQKKENVIKTIEMEKEPKDKIKKIFKKSERKHSKEKRYTKVKIDPSKKEEDMKNLKLNINLNLNNYKKPNNKLKKVNTKSSKNCEILTESSINGNKISKNKINSSYNRKSNNSNSDSKTTNCSKNPFSKMKEKIKSLSIINTEDLNINFNKSKSPDTRKHVIFKSKLKVQEEFLHKGEGNNYNINYNIHQIKKEKSKENNKFGIKNMENKFKIEDEDRKNENKENIEINKNNGEKDLDKNNEMEILNLSINNKDSLKKTKKKYRKIKSDDYLKEENEHSEKCNNDSESCIIDGDSEYGDSELL